MLKNVIIKDPDTVHISEKAKFEISHGKKITIIKNCTISDNALIVADKDDCVISDSFISSKVRVRNSKIESVFAGSGSQILESNITIGNTNAEEPKRYLVFLKPGSSYDDNNFAFSRGAVIKRIPDLKIINEIRIPSGHCLINLEELEKVKLRNDRQLRIFLEIEGPYFIINSQYSHTEIYEQFYDPEKFDQTDYVQKGNEIRSEDIFDISNIAKSGIVENSAEQERIKQIRKDSNQLEIIRFLDKESGITIIKRLRT